MADLPTPTSSRWQPQRLGLIDLFYYDDEVIPFVDGRLLLRGNNGTGKSKVLALTLPFLLDGDLSPRRVEPDADPNKRMEWNLLLGGAHPHSERLGYAWLEFGRVDEDGVAHYCTLGAGLKAVTGRGMARHWFFMTDQRVGWDLHLLDPSRTALSRERLGEALGARGRIFDAKRDYRRAVDETLFGLGERRYDALVDLLVQLRQPQLSKRPNERALSDALTEALSPVRDDLIEYVAEGFRGLDDERRQLAELLDTTRAADAFLAHYRRYARVMVRRRAEGPRVTHARVEQLGRDLVRIREEVARAGGALAAANDRLRALHERRATLDAEFTALVEGEHADGEAQLAAADREVGSAKKREHEAVAGHERAERDLHAARDRLQQARAVTEREVEARETARRAAADAATAADMEAEHAELLADDALPLERVRRRSHELLTRRRRALARVHELIEGTERAEQELAAARLRHDDVTALLDRAAERAHEARAAREAAGDSLLGEVRAYLDALVEARPEDPASVLEELRVWTETLAGPNPTAAAVGSAADRVRGEVAAARARAHARDQDLAEGEARLAEEIATLEGGRSEPPPLRHTRATGSLPGLPLWRSVDFAASLTPDESAGLEAALEAAGLLDAHVLPGGTLRSANDGEVLLSPPARVARPEDPPPGEASARLADALRPSLPPGAAGVREEDVARVLDHVALLPAGHEPDSGASGPTSWVSFDGRFRVGVATGAWSKPEAAHIGEGAREAARQRRLREARAERDALAAERAALGEALERLDARLARLRDEVEGLPTDAALRDAHAAVTAAQGAVEEATAARATAVERVEAAVDEAQRHTTELSEAAAALRLPITRVQLDAVGRAIEAYAAALQASWHAAELAAREERDLATALDEHRRAEDRHEEAARTKQRCEEDRAAAEARFATLDATLGADVREFQRRRADVAERRAEAEAALDRMREEVSAARTAEALAEERARTCEERQATAASDRDAAIAALRRTAATSLVSVAAPDVDVPDGADPWTPTQAVGLARTLERELAATDADDAAWGRVQARLSTEFTNLQSALSRHGHTAIFEPGDDGHVVRIVFGGKATAVADLVATLRADIEARERLLDAREREIIENHLVTEVGADLAALVSEAEAQLRALNAELSDRPTSTGMKLRVVWRTRHDGPPGLSEARKRLLQLSDAWSGEDRQAIGAFLQRRIAAVREADETGTWYEHLEQALDYRSWHRFVVERYQNGAWRPATGPASGGERVLAVSVPLFAAASSHYRSASKPHAARLVVLDEAFAGVDDDSRAKSLGLLHAFDLDVAMTSEREWGCYPEVPGLSIAQLSRIEGVPAVLVTLWAWNGSVRRRADANDEGGSSAEPEPNAERGSRDRREAGDDREANAREPSGSRAPIAERDAT